jgi:hypothetical protein
MAYLQDLRSVLFTLAILAGPIFWIACILRSERQEGGVWLTLASRVHAGMTWWFGLQMTVATLLGAFGAFHIGLLLRVEGFLLVSGAVVFSFVRDRSKRNPLLSGTIPWTPLDWTVLGTLTVGALAIFYHTLTHPTMEYDSLAYHFPFIGNLCTLGYFDPQAIKHVEYYPFGWETLIASIVLPCRQDIFIHVANVAVWLYFGLGMALLAKRLGGNRGAILCSVALLMFCPVVVENVWNLHVDLPFAAFFIGASLYAIDFARRPTPVSFGGSIIAFGLMGAIKVTAVLYLVPLIFLGGMEFFAVKNTGISREIEEGPGKRERFFIRTLACLIGGFLGSFWYARNLVQTGNPLGTAEIKIAGKVLFPGPYPYDQCFAPTTLAAAFDWGNRDHWLLVEGEFLKYLGFTVGILLTLAICAICIELRPGVSKVRRYRIVGLAATFAMTVWIYCHTPYSGRNGVEGIVPFTAWMGHNLRFFLPGLGILGALAGSCPFGNGGRVRRWIALAVWIGFFFAWRFIGFLPSVKGGLFLFVTLGCIAFLSGKMPSRVRTRYAVWAIVATFAIGCLLMPKMRALRDRRRAETYDWTFGGLMTAVRDRNPGRSAVGMLFCHRGAVLYGSRIEYPVIDVTHHEAKTESEWIAWLHDRGIRLIAVGPIPAFNEGKELDWVNTDTGAHFLRVFGSDSKVETVLYEVR